MFDLAALGFAASAAAVEIIRSNVKNYPWNIGVQMDTIKVYILTLDVGTNRLQILTWMCLG